MAKCFSISQCRKNYLRVNPGVDRYFLDALASNNEFKSGCGEDGSDVAVSRFTPARRPDFTRCDHFDPGDTFQNPNDQCGRFGQCSMARAAGFWHRCFPAYHTFYNQGVPLTLKGISRTIAPF